MSILAPVERVNFASGTDGTVYTIPSWTPPANTVLEMFVACGHASAATEPTITGTLGLAWTKVAGQVTTGGTLRGTLYRAVTNGSPPTGTIVLTFGTTHSSVDVFINSLPGVDLANPVKQIGTPFQTTTTANPGITLPNPVTAGNMTRGYNVWNRTFVLPPGSGYAQTNAGTGQSTPTMIASTEHKLAGAQLVDWTTTDSIQKVLFAVEWQAAAGGAPLTGDWLLGAVAFPTA